MHISGGISGTVRSAEQARDQLVERGVAAERIVIVDSASVCAGLGLMAVAAANAAADGADAAGAAAAARALREELKILFAVDTLEFLRRGGRIGGAQAWIGSTLRIKPILAIESEVVPVERVRTWGRAFERMVDHLQSLRDDGADRFYVQHIQAPDQAEKLAQRGEAIYGRPPDLVSEMGPVIGTHAGPGLIGVTALRGELVGPSERRRRGGGAPPARERGGDGRAAGPSRSVHAAARARASIVPHRADRRAGRALAVPDLPAAPAADVDLHRRLPRHRALRARSTSSPGG